VDFPVGDQTIKVLRGWIAVEVKIHGARFKFVDTHLECPIPYPPEYVAPTQYVQELQATQLMEDLEDVKLPIILAGDFNSDAKHTMNYPSDNTNSYSIIAGNNFKDAWDELRPNNPGFTWSLMEVPNTAPGVNFTPFERIDLIFSDGPEAVSIMRTGIEKLNGLYASDHAGVVAVFDLTNPHPSHQGRSYRYPMEYSGFHMPAHLFKYFRSLGFRRH
jgi:endonuclease/exonuclease/phosphatase family metal-dependent hydrolase